MAENIRSRKSRKRVGEFSVPAVGSIENSPASCPDEDTGVVSRQNNVSIPLSADENAVLSAVGRQIDHASEVPLEIDAKRSNTDIFSNRPVRCLERKYFLCPMTPACICI